MMLGQVIVNVCCVVRVIVNGRCAMVVAHVVCVLVVCYRTLGHNCCLLYKK